MDQTAPSNVQVSQKFLSQPYRLAARRCEKDTCSLGDMCLVPHVSQVLPHPGFDPTGYTQPQMETSNSYAKEYSIEICIQ